MSPARGHAAKPTKPPRRLPGGPTRVSKREIARDLAHIYGEFTEEGDLAELTQAPTKRSKLIVVGTIAFFGALAAAAWAGFFVFAPGQRAFDGEQVKVTIEGPAQATSGNPTSYTARIANTGSQPLAATHLTLRLPAAFAVRELTPSPTNADAQSTTHEFSLGSLPAGSERTVTVDGELIAALGKTVDLQALLSYRPAAWNADFQSVATLPVTVTSSTLALTTTGPEKAVPGDAVRYETTLKNTEDALLTEATVEFAPPPGFLIESSTPAFASDRAVWAVRDLAAGAEAKFSVTGTFASTAKGPQEVAFGVSVPSAQGPVAQARGVATTEALGTTLAIGILANGNADLVAAHGDTLRFAVSWKNVGTAMVEDATLRVRFDGVPASAAGLINWDKLADADGGTRKGDVLTWTKKQIASLGKIAPGEEGALSFSVPAAALPAQLNPHSAYGLAVTAELAPATLDGEKTTRTVRSQATSIGFRSDAALSAEAHYFSDEGVQLGKGPLPPKVGEATTSRVTWRITNTAHELEKLYATATLPENVTWGGNATAEAGAVTYDAKTRTVRWDLNWLPLAVGDLRAAFDVTLTPSAGQKGTVPTILGATTFGARDKAIGKDFALLAPELTTAFVGDELAKGKGRVE
jgi:hypothetical protein